jgi:hypothetical protein
MHPQVIWQRISAEITELEGSGVSRGSAENRMAPDLSTIDEIRRRVIRELVDVEIVRARRLPRRQRIFRKLRRGATRIIGTRG